MNNPGVSKFFVEFLAANRRMVVVAILTIAILVGCIAVTVRMVKGSQTAIDTLHLKGKVFFVRVLLSNDPAKTQMKRYIAVMNANGTDNRVLAEDFDFVFDLMWYSKLESLVVLKTSNDRFMAGDYTLKISGKSAADLSVGKIERSIPDDFRTKFYDPAWEYKDGRYVLLPNSRTYSSRITFSPDGKRIAGLVDVMDTASNTTKSRMCVVSTDGSAPENCNLLVEGCQTQSPVWSPDGSKVIFSGAFMESAAGCNLMELYIADADMKNAYQLTNIDGPKIPENNYGMVKPGVKVKFWHKSTHPKWSPDGRWIAFMSYSGIYRVHPDGTGLQLVIRDGYYPAWSPDGTMLMYVEMAGSPIATSGPSDRIFVALADGSSPTEIKIDNNGPSRITYQDLNWAE